MSQQINNPARDLFNNSEVLSKLSQIDWGFTNYDTGYLTHDIHPYAAKFIPQIPSHIIDLLSVPGELIWDPFGGSGTTALEATLLARKAISSDINPLARIIGQAKTTVLSTEEELQLKNWLASLQLLSQDPENLEKILAESEEDWARLVPDIPNIERWFHSYAVRELALLRWAVSTRLTEKQQILSYAAFSKTVLKVSYQDGETRYTAKTKTINKGTTLNIFIRELQFSIEKMRQLRQLSMHPQVDFKVLDLRQPLDGHAPIQQNSVALIVTSPPYPNAYDYHLYHRFRLFWLGYDPRTLAKQEVGSHLRHQKEKTGFDQYISEMSCCLQNFWWALRPGRYAVLVVGDGLFQGTTYSTSTALATQASAIGFEVVGIISREIHRTKRAFATPARRANQEQLLIIQKPV